MTSLSRGRPSIAESELPQNIKIALASRVTGKTWKACAAEAGIAYSTLRDWLRNNPDAKFYLKENCDDYIDQSYFFMARRSPEVAEELYKIMQSGGMQQDEFDMCLSDINMENDILEGVMNAQKEFNIRSTPSFIINGILYSGNKSTKEFRQIIDKTLSQ